MNKQWEQIDDNTWYLYFTPFYDEEHIATLRIDEQGEMYADCSMLAYENDYRGSADENSIASAQKDLEDEIAEDYLNMVNYYQDMYDKFTEGEEAT